MEVLYTGICHTDLHQANHNLPGNDGSSTPGRWPAKCQRVTREPVDRTSVCRSQMGARERAGASLVPAMHGRGPNAGASREPVPYRPIMNALDCWALNWQHFRDIHDRLLQRISGNPARAYGVGRKAPDNGSFIPHTKQSSARRGHPLKNSSPLISLASTFSIISAPTGFWPTL
jgi:hypothetical protein